MDVEGPQNEEIAPLSPAFFPHKQASYSKSAQVDATLSPHEKKNVRLATPYSLIKSETGDSSNWYRSSSHEDALVSPREVVSEQEASKIKKKLTPTVHRAKKKSWEGEQVCIEAKYFKKKQAQRAKEKAKEKMKNKGEVKRREAMKRKKDESEEDDEVTRPAKRARTGQERRGGLMRSLGRLRGLRAHGKRSRDRSEGDSENGDGEKRKKEKKKGGIREPGVKKKPIIHVPSSGDEGGESEEIIHEDEVKEKEKMVADEETAHWMAKFVERVKQRIEHPRVLALSKKIEPQSEREATKLDVISVYNEITEVLCSQEINWELPRAAVEAPVAPVQRRVSTESQSPSLSGLYVLLGDLRPMRENGGHIRLKNNLHKTCKELAELLGATVISSASVGKLRTKMSSRNPSGDPRMICIASDGICSSLRKSVAYLHSVPLVHFSFLFHCAFAFQRLPVDNYVIRNPILPLSWEKEPIEPAQLPPELAAVEGPQVDREFPFEAEDGHLPRVEIVGSKAFHDRWTRALQESGVFLTRRLGSAHEQFHFVLTDGVVSPKVLHALDTLKLAFPVVNYKWARLSLAARRLVFPTPDLAFFGVLPAMGTMREKLDGIVVFPERATGNTAQQDLLPC